MPKIITSEDDENYTRFKDLKKGDHLYTIEIEHDGEDNTNTVRIRDLIFQHFEGPKDSKIESIKDYNIGDPIMATLIDEKFPKVEIKNQDIGAGWFLSAVGALDASIDMFETLLKCLKDKKQNVIFKGEYDESL